MKIIKIIISFLLLLLAFSSKSQELPLPQKQVIKPTAFKPINVIGKRSNRKVLKEVLQLMPVGSKRKVFMPSELGYGPNETGTEIKGISRVIFEIELISIEH